MYIHGLCQSSFCIALKLFRHFYKMFICGTQRIRKFILTLIRGREHSAKLAEALHFDSWWDHWNFSFT